MCALVLILWGFNAEREYFQACFYDCGKKRHKFYDQVFFVDAEKICPARIYGT